MYLVGAETESQGKYVYPWEEHPYIMLITLQYIYQTDLSTHLTGHKMSVYGHTNFTLASE